MTMTYYEKLSPEEVRENIEVCNEDCCLNNYTPYKAEDGSRYCISHKDEAC